MFGVMVPPTFVSVLAAFAPCFTAPSYRTFQWLVAGWVQCLGRRTITAVALASGAVGERHISVFHRFFARGRWCLDALGQVVFRLALAWIPAGQPLVFLGDDTLARKGGKGIALAAMHHDPLLSSARRPFFSFGHVWVVLALWVPLPMGNGRGVALPVLFRLYVGAKRGGQADAPSRPRGGARHRAAQTAHAQHRRATKLELLREMVGVVAGWADGRPLYLVVDSAYAGRTLLEDRPPGVHVVSRLRMDAALWTPPSARRPGQTGRPRKRGTRLPNPKALAAARSSDCWHRLPITIYGRQVTTRVFSRTALWYTALRDQPVRIVLVRDPGGRRKDEAFFCTDRAVGAAFILETYARRWTLEVAFRDQKQFLGFAQPQNQAPRAVARTAPLAGIVYALVLLWYAGQLQHGRVAGWVVRPWYRAKTAPSFLDMLTTLRQESWRPDVSAPPCPARRRQNPAPRSPPTGQIAA